jgi:hypothetical protein
MSSLIVPAGYVRNSSVGSVFGRFEGEVRRAIVTIVRNSFRTHPVQVSVTSAIINERLDYCIVTAAQLLRDMKWAPERIIDTLPKALAAKLDNKPWEPSQRDSWGSRDTDQGDPCPTT